MKTIRFWTAAIVVGWFMKPGLAQDPWPAKDLIRPFSLAGALADKGRSAPAILFVGFPVLYRGAHLPGAIPAGPGSKIEGLERLKDAVRALPRDLEVVLYCGCCPFMKCPNIKPAYTALRQMGFSHLKVMVIQTNLHTDWVAKGYPVEKGS